MVELFCAEKFKIVAWVLSDGIEGDGIVKFNDDRMVTVIFWLIEIDELFAKVVLKPGVCVVFDRTNIV